MTLKQLELHLGKDRNDPWNENNVVTYVRLPISTVAFWGVEPIFSITISGVCSAEGPVDRKRNIEVKNCRELSVWKSLFSFWIHFTFQHLSKVLAWLKLWSSYLDNNLAKREGQC